MMSTFEVKTKNDISLAPKLHSSIKHKLQRIIMYLSLHVTTFLPWVLPTGGVACVACLMTHIISSMRTPSSSYIRPDNTEVQTGAELSGWWLRIHSAATTREQHEGYINYYGVWCYVELYALTQLRLLVVCTQSYLAPHQTPAAEMPSLSPSLSAQILPHPTDCPPDTPHAHGTVKRVN